MTIPSTPRRTAILIGVFATTALTAVYNGGAASDVLFSLLAALLATAILIGAPAWSNLIYSPRVLTDRSFRRLGFPVVVALYTLGLVCAVWISPTPGLGLEVALRLALLPALYAVTQAALNAGIKWHDLWTSVRWVGLTLSIMALAEKLLTGDRVYTTLSDPNALAGIFNVFVLIELFAIFKECANGQVDRFRILALSSFALAAGTTGSLSGLICLFAILFCSAIVVTVKLPAVKQRIKPWLLVTLVLVLAIAGSRGGGDAPATKLQSISRHSSFTVRVELTQAALSIYRDHAWNGTGIGSFAMYYPRYRGPLDTGSAGILVHNDYAQFLVEGGPLSLSSLLLLGSLVLFTLLTSLRKTNDEILDLHLERMGACFALLLILLQASMNFMFYVAIVPLLFGVLLARLAMENTANVQSIRASKGQSLIFGVTSGALVVLLVGIMGARGLFILLTVENRCDAHACASLRNDLKFMSRLSAYLSGSQPTWLPARAYIVADLLKGAANISDENYKNELRLKAAKELIRLIWDVPLLPDSYANLANLIREDPKLVDLIKTAQGTLSLDPIDLYRHSLELIPQNISFRLKLAAALKDAHKEQDAYQILSEGLRYWRMEDWGDAERMELLEKIIPLAISLHHCTEAEETTEALKVFLAGEQQARATGNMSLLPSRATPQLIQDGREAISIGGGNCS